VVLGSCLLLVLLPLMSVVARADGPKSGAGQKLTGNTTVSVDIQESIVTSILVSCDFGSVPAGTATEASVEVSYVKDANVQNKLAYSMDVHVLGDFTNGVDAMPISALKINGGDLHGYTTTVLTSRGIHILVDGAVPATDADPDYSFDLKLTPPSQMPAGADYTTTLQFTSYQ
jgi:hypothetical protein